MRELESLYAPPVRGIHKFGHLSQQRGSNLRRSISMLSKADASLSPIARHDAMRVRNACSLEDRDPLSLDRFNMRPIRRQSGEARERPSMKRNLLFEAAMSPVLNHHPQTFRVFWAHRDASKIFGP